MGVGGGGAIQMLSWTGRRVLCTTARE